MVYGSDQSDTLHYARRGVRALEDVMYFTTTHGTNFKLLLLQPWPWVVVSILLH